MKRPAGGPARIAAERGVGSAHAHAAALRDIDALGSRPAGGLSEVDAGADAGPDARPDAGRVHYVYGIIRVAGDRSASTASSGSSSSTPSGGAVQSLKFGAIGIDSGLPDVYTVHLGELAAVVSDVPGSPLDATREHVLAHERVNEAVMREHTVIPMSFGATFRTTDDVVELLRSGEGAFTQALARMQGTVEYGVKVLWDCEALVADIEREDEDIRRLKLEIASPNGSTYFARMQYGRLIDASVQRRHERYVAELLHALRDVSIAVRVNRAIGDRMILNAAFLLRREQEEAFERRLMELGGQFDMLTLRYSGPWPAYHFVNIRLKLERAEGI